MLRRIGESNYGNGVCSGKEQKNARKWVLGQGNTVDMLWWGYAGAGKVRLAQETLFEKQSQAFAHVN